MVGGRRSPLLSGLAVVAVLTACSEVRTRLPADPADAPPATVRAATVPPSDLLAGEGYLFLDWVLDDGGVNDEPDQSDLNAFTRADNKSGWIGVMWTWDDVNAWTGSGQTGDACALFDTDGDGNANYAACDRITNTPDGSDIVQLADMPVLYGCSDKAAERCSKPVTGPLSLAGSHCQARRLGYDGFADAGMTSGDDGDDAVAACAIKLSAIGNSTNTNLTNVCSFPSGSPNSNPFDCVVTAGAGFIQIVKHTLPASTDTFRFTLSPAASSGVSSFKTVGADTLALIPVAPGSTYSLTEGAVTGWTLKSASCVRQTGGAGTATGTSGATGVSAITVTIGETTTCTFLNSVVAPTITVKKTASPTSIPETGDSVRFAVEVTNTSLVAVTLDSLQDRSFGALAGMAGSTCTLPQTIAASAKYSCSFPHIFPADTAGHVHIDTVRAVAHNDGGTATASDTAKVTFTDVAPAVTVSKTATPTHVRETGDSVLFTVSVHNTGTVVATLDSLIDNVFGALQGVGTCVRGGTLKVDSTYACSFKKRLAGNAGTTHLDSVIAVVKDADGTKARDTASATVTFDDSKTHITVTKTVSPTTLGPGTSTLTFSPQDSFTTNPSGGGGMQFLSPTFDTDGANDQPAQSDLNWFSRADNVAGQLGIRWTWDDVNSWTGTGQTGDACALLDTNNNGKAEYALCVRITNTPSGDSVYQLPSPDSPLLYGCNDKMGDRCGKPALLTVGSNSCSVVKTMGDRCGKPELLTVGSNSCSVVKTTGETMSGGEDGADTQATCILDKTSGVFAGKTNISLLNVCSFPSGSPNSNAFDCVVRSGVGFLQIAKVNSPSTDTTSAGFTLSPAADNGHTRFQVKGGITSALLPAGPGSYSIVETAATHHALTAVQCKINGVTQTITWTSGSSTVSAIPVQTGQTTVCTFTNTWSFSDSVTYTVKVKNDSTEAVTLTYLTDDKFGNLIATGAPCDTVSKAIAGKATYTCTFKKLLTGNAGTTHTNIVTGKAKDDELNEATGSGTATVTFIGP